MGYLIRLIIIALLVWLAYRFIRKLAEPAGRRDTGTLPREEMVRCEVCGLHVPRKSAFSHRDHFFCSIEHMESEKKE